MHNLVIITGPGLSTIPSHPFDVRNWTASMERRQAAIRAFPNDAHHAIQALCARGAKLITLNTDNLHEQAGSVPLHLRGEIFKSRCSLGCSDAFEDYATPSLNPSCKVCGAALRVDVLGPLEKPTQIDLAMHYVSHCQRLLVIGDVCASYPVAYLPLVAKSLHAHVSFVGPEQPNNDYLFDCVHLGLPQYILPQLAAH